MGELHLEIYVERMKREYNVECTTGRPRVAFRETPTQRAEFSYTHKKQTGGAGQFARVMGYIEPMEYDEERGTDIEFENHVMGGNIPSNYIPACEKVTSPPTLMSRDIDLFRRVSTKHWRKVSCRATRFVVYVWCYRMVSRTLSIPQNWRSDLPSLVLSVKSTPSSAQSSSSP